MNDDVAGSTQRTVHRLATPYRDHLNRAEFTDVTPTPEVR